MTWNVEEDERGILHRHADDTEHRHFRAGFTIGNQTVPDDTGDNDHKHGTLFSTEDSGYVVWTEEETWQ